MRLIRVMCSGRVDLEFIFRAFYNGMDGVFIGGCKLGECNYITHGNYDALSNTHIAQKILHRIGLNPERLRIAFMSGADGNLLADITDEFIQQVNEIGPLGEAEGLEVENVKFKIQAVRKLIPYLKLVERERLRAPSKSAEAYKAFFQSGDVDRLFKKLFTDKLAISQIMLLLEQHPLSTAEISARLELNPSDVSRHMTVSSRQGLVKYDTANNYYALV